MKRPLHFRPRFEQLENRLCPSVSASVSAGLLTITGAATNAGDTIFVKEVAANQFEVDDGATPVGGSDTTPFTATSVKLKLTGADDTVQIDLEANTIGGNVAVNLGGGTNSLTMKNGTISGGLGVSGGNNTDTVTVNALVVTKNADINLGGGSDDVLSLVGSSFAANLTTYYVNNITLDAGSQVAKSFTIYGGSAGNAVAIDGTVGHNLTFQNSYFLGNDLQPSSLTLGSTAHVGNNLIYVSPYRTNFGSDLTLKAGSTVGNSVYYDGTNKADTVAIAGSISGSLYLDMDGGNDAVTVASTAAIATRASIYFGNGNNSLDFAGTVGPAGGTATALIVSAGRGSNVITIDNAAIVNGNARILLGSGANLLDLHDGATITGKLTANGGGNALTKFHGSTQPNHTSLLITGFPIMDNSANP